MSKGLKAYQGDEIGNTLLGLNGYGMVYDDTDWRINGLSVGGVGDITVSGGSGYDPADPPGVTFNNHPTDFTGVGATAVATVVGDAVTKITITNPGKNYHRHPIVVVESPTSGVLAAGTVDKLVNMHVLPGSTGPSTDTLHGMAIPYDNGGTDFNGAMLKTYFTAIKNVTLPSATLSLGRVQIDIKTTIGSGSNDFTDGWGGLGSFDRFYIEPGQILYGNFIAVKISSATGSSYKPRILLYY